MDSFDRIWIFIIENLKGEFDLLGIFLDTETNGLNFRKHRILEIAFKIMDLKKKECLATFEEIIYQPADVWEKSDPNSLQINGFCHKDLKDGISEAEASNLIIKTFTDHHVSRKNAVFICQNPSFDRSFFSQLVSPETQEELNWPYHWLDLASMFWATYMREEKGFPIKVGLSKDKIASYYQLPPEDKPHKALNGVKHLMSCYYSVLDQ